jgi:hypothetical protein
LHGLGALAVILTLLDNWTTWVCLRAPVAGWVVREANPIGARLFEGVGLGPGLWIDFGVTLVAVTFLVWSSRLSRTASAGCLALISLSTALGVGNNVAAIMDLGLW